MNAERRKRIRAVLTSLDNIVDLINDAYTEIDEVSADEQAAYDNLPDSIQQSERGERMEEVASSLADIADLINALAEDTNEIFVQLEDLVAD